MLGVIWKRQISENADLASLEDLRGHLLSRFSWLIIVCSALAMWLTLPQDPLPLVPFGLWTVLLLLGLGIRVVTPQRLTLGRHILVWGLTTELVAAMWLFDDAWIPFVGMLLAFVGPMLVSGSELVIATIICFVAAELTQSGIRAYPLLHVLVGLALSAATGRLAVNTLFTALEWLWKTHVEVNRLLAEARDRRAEIGRVVKSMDFANNLLERRTHELAAARMQAEEARRLKAQFAANISHELRTPLNIILGFSEVMYMSPEVYGDAQWPPALRQDIQHVYRSSRHLLDLINDVLDLSRYEIAEFALNKEPTAMGPFLGDVMEIAKTLFLYDPVRLETKIPKDLPTLKIDRTRVRQVVLNLVNNAQSFTEVGTVCVEAQRTDGEIVVSVSDTGIGIPAEKLPLIFDEFYQVDGSPRRARVGAGLGLAISKRFVKAHGGRIWVESQLGVGSTFFFNLPLSGYDPPESGVRQEFPARPALSKMRPTILVVDPDPTVAEMVRRHMGRYEVVQVEEAGRLNESVMMHYPQAILYNTQSGETEGVEKTVPLRVPIIQCMLPSKACTAANLSVNACLRKPFTAQELVAVVGRLDGINNILIVDDDRSFVQLVDRILQSMNRPFTVRRAYDGGDGLSAMGRQRPDLLLLDLVMPGMNGFQVLEAMRGEADLTNVRVVLLTGTSLADDALVQHGGAIIIHRSGGLSPGEVLRCLNAVIDTLEPHYDEPAVLDSPIPGVKAPSADATP